MNSKISTYLVGVVIFSLVMIGGVQMIGILNAKNGAISEQAKYSEFNRTAGQLEQVSDELTSLGNSLDVPPDTGTLGVLNALINTAWNALVTIPTTFSFVGSIFVDLSDLFGIPAWIPGLLLGIITVIILFSIWGAIFQHEL